MPFPSALLPHDILELRRLDLSQLGTLQESPSPEFEQMLFLSSRLSLSDRQVQLETTHEAHCVSSSAWPQIGNR